MLPCKVLFYRAFELRNCHFGINPCHYFGGVHRIAAISSVIVPVMAVGYIALALFVVLANIDRIPAVVEQIVGNAFGWHQAVGGGIGTALMQGIKRGLFSNEAGMGSAPNAAATAHVTHPAKQGFIQALGVFTDTLLICSCTAFIICLVRIMLAVAWMVFS